MRVKITLACSECKQRNYNTFKNKKNDPDRLEFSKYCRFCRKHTVHKEGSRQEEGEGSRLLCPDRQILPRGVWRGKETFLAHQKGTCFLYPHGPCVHRADEHRDRRA